MKSTLIRVLSAGAAAAATLWIAAPAQAVPFQQDMLIKLKGDASFLGNNFYNDAGGPMGEQTRTTSIKRTRTARFIIKAQNDGNKNDKLRIALGIFSGKDGKWKTVFTKGAKDVTAEVKGAGYITPKLAPGESVKLKLQITNVAPAGPCNCADLYIDAYSNGKGDATVDTVRAKVDDLP